ncbi:MULTISPECIES: DUF4160 domain-containing protein [Photorhabdus]|uniref:DUF4160 domain-containing protein n=1 Tax=Photorhabdus TaxID=29487 RepID=UPI00195F6543|nr:MULTISPECIES: DUF4160 domain-containing protein [Photorhabdus]MCT8342979.1 DUF4160 domain-containing protein [Photorhabdus kleinii]
MFLRPLQMPTISEFFGILIRMYYDDHNPPHFHAYYGEHEAIISIETLEVMEGSLPKRAKGYGHRMGG